MHNVENYISCLAIYILVVLAFALLGFLVLNLLFWILRICNLFYEKRVWLLTNVVLAVLFFVHIIPVVLDICQSSFSTIENVVKMETDFVADKSSKYIIITDEIGEVFTCYDYLIDTKQLYDVEYPGTVVYAKHSKLMLEYYPGEDRKTGDGSVS